jgi:hypothetical protein
MSSQHHVSCLPPITDPADIIEEVRDVYLDEFADTDDEHDDEEAEEREIRREEKRKVRPPL